MQEFITIASFFFLGVLVWQLINLKVSYDLEKSAKNQENRRVQGKAKPQPLAVQGNVVLRTKKG